jgi:hypothetical protein
MGTPASWITVVGVNPVPVTTIVTADDPTGTSLGETDEMASGPAPEVDPELPGAPPHPESRVRRRQKDTRRTKLKSPAALVFMSSAQTIRPQVIRQEKNNNSAGSKVQNDRSQPSVSASEKNNRP